MTDDDDDWRIYPNTENQFKAPLGSNRHSLLPPDTAVWLWYESLCVGSPLTRSLTDCLVVDFSISNNLQEHETRWIYTAFHFTNYMIRHET